MANLCGIKIKFTSLTKNGSQILAELTSAVLKGRRGTIFWKVVEWGGLGLRVGSLGTLWDDLRWKRRLGLEKSESYNKSDERKQKNKFHERVN